MSITILEILLPFIIFFIGTIFITIVIVFLPFMIGKKMPPSYSIKESLDIQLPREYLYNLLVDYKNYTSWKPYLKSVEVSINKEGKTTWVEFHKKWKIKNTFIETKKIENSLLIFSNLTEEYASVCSFEIEEKDEQHCKLNIKETLYLTHPYLRFFSRLLLNKKKSIKNILHLLKKAAQRINNA